MQSTPLSSKLQTEQDLDNNRVINFYAGPGALPWSKF